MKHWVFVIALLSSAPAYSQPISCNAGMAGAYPCQNVDLLAHLPFYTPPTPLQRSSDIWGWTDPASGTEYAIITQYDHTAFVQRAPRADRGGMLGLHAGGAVLPGRAEDEGVNGERPAPGGNEPLPVISHGQYPVTSSRKYDNCHPTMSDSAKVDVEWYLKQVFTDALNALEGGLTEQPDTAISDAVEYRGLDNIDAAVNIAERLRAIDQTRNAIQSGDFSSVGTLAQLMRHIIDQTGREVVQAGYADLQHIENRVMLTGRVLVAKAVLDALGESDAE